MTISIGTIESYPDVMAFFKKYFGDFVEKIENITVFEIPEKTWEGSMFSGEGFMARRDNFEGYEHFFELAIKNRNIYATMSDEQKKMANAYSLWKRANKPDIFIAILPDSEEFIVHEASHIIDVASKYELMNFGDEYLDTKSEQFSHMNEMKYAQDKGLTFDQYFKKTWRKAWEIIQQYNSGDRSREGLYEACMMDMRDYKKMWDYVEKFYAKNGLS